MGAVFQSVFAWAQPLMNLIDWGMTRVGTAVASVMAEGPLRSLVERLVAMRKAGHGSGHNKQIAARLAAQSALDEIEKTL